MSKKRQMYRFYYLMIQLFCYSVSRLFDDDCIHPFGSVHFEIAIFVAVNE